MPDTPRSVDPGRGYTTKKMMCPSGARRTVAFTLGTLSYHFLPLCFLLSLFSVISFPLITWHSNTRHWLCGLDLPLYIHDLLGNNDRPNF
ncbi:hypothetical protein SODALDRAFT_118070 [Sodiomyces alkalinus F11]|uniref:Uncharacterized protein n=1 Tax=Sodiomyces alkalinus (strain CBS 110278 / VKM F-3762 / F11) TaxID=1314773 RepID=A0A3N2Q3P4_SODAK|nr:hypothetical protein SODALDRAFT_118070 [Sodiomyces alkalinus F11]ROT41380.1 hypothetical protein SODALDRAFT_118070 [Sodiomyces alkalinus F11]